MSSALAMILTAAMAVPANGPEKVSAEMEQRLDLSGEWEGTWQLTEGAIYSATIEYFARINEAILCGHSPRGGGICFKVSSFHDEGNGRFRIEPKDTENRWLGIYKEHNGRIFLCFGDKGCERPRTFRGGDGQHILILHRVKRRK